MSIGKPFRIARNIRSSNAGSILIYVLWILVVISVLAFQLASASRVMTVNRSAFANQIKKQMQIESAVQFAMFKIMANQWKDKSFKLQLNNQEIGVRIFNESGFVSLYELSSKTLDNVFEFVGLDRKTVEELEKAISRNKKPIKFNDFVELRQFTGIDDEVLERLIPLVSIYHEDPVNPMQSPVEVLMQFHRIDQYRVQKLREATDESERAELRKEIVQSLSVRDMELSENLGLYYRIHISLNGLLHRVFLRYDRQQKRYKVVMINSSEAKTNASAS